MTIKSPIAVIYGNDGSNYVETTVRTATAIASGQPGLLVLGSDGTNSRFLNIDSTGRIVNVGAAANGAAVSGNPLLIAGSDGTNARTLRTATDGTLRIDPTGTTTQPISASSLPLPTGAATETTLATLLTTSAFQARINTLGQKTMANSTPVTFASDQSTLTISGTVTANIGTSGSLALDATLAKLTIAQNAALGSNTMALMGGSVSTAAPAYSNGNINALSLTTAGLLRVDGSGVTQPISATSLPLPTGAATETTLSALNAKFNSLGQKTMANSAPVVISSDQSTIPVKLQSTTATTSSVTSSASSVTLLSANTSRLGATIWNDSTKILYVKLGTTASSTDYTAQLNKDDYYEIPFGYTGRIDGIWASANGNARITELT